MLKKIHHSSRSNGFTLVELLVAIVVLAVISTIGLNTYFHAQVTGRDSRRKQDIRSIAIALELYNQRLGHYPCTGGTIKTSAGGQPWISDGGGCTPTDSMIPNFIQNLPLDPINSGTSIYKYKSLAGGQCSLVTDGGGFVLVSILENSSDHDAIGGGSRKLCDGTNVDSGSWGAGAFIVSNN